MLAIVTKLSREDGPSQPSATLHGGGSGVATGGGVLLLPVGEDQLHSSDEITLSLPPSWTAPLPGNLEVHYIADTPEALRGLPSPTVQSVNVATQLLPPQINSNGVVNGADYGRMPFAPGTILSIFGGGLSSPTASAGVVPLPTTLAGTQVLVNGKAAPLFYASPLQINFQLPFEATGSFASVQVVTVQGSILTSIALTGLSAAGFAGQNGETIVNATTYNWTTGKAMAGQVATVFGTGFGAVTPAVPSGMPSPRMPLSTLVKPVTISMCGQNAQVLWVGLAPDFVGLYQANIIVPTACAQATDARVHIAAQ